MKAFAWEKTKCMGYGGITLTRLKPLLAKFSAMILQVFTERCFIRKVSGDCYGIFGIPQFQPSVTQICSESLPLQWSRPPPKLVSRDAEPSSWPPTLVYSKLLLKRS